MTSPTLDAPTMTRLAVEIADEEAVIFWDPETHVEHFIRKATFRSSAPAFGFLVPTPSTPKLDEVPETVFGELEHEVDAHLPRHLVALDHRHDDRRDLDEGRPRGCRCRVPNSRSPAASSAS